MTGDPVRPYEPIDCSLHDRVEDLATRRARVHIRYADDGGTVEVRDTIADWFVRDGAEFMRTAGGSVIRMDRILAIDGVACRSSPEG